MRLTGALALTAAGLLAGLAGADRLRARAALRAELCRMLDMMEFELDRFMTPLPALFAKLGELLDGEAGALCRRMAEELARPEGREAAALWTAALASLPEQERRLLELLGPVLGRYGAAEQVRALAGCCQQMERARDGARAALRERGKLWVGLSAAGAAALAVLLM